MDQKPNTDAGFWLGLTFDFPAYEPAPILAVGGFAAGPSPHKGSNPIVGVLLRRVEP